MNLTLPISGKFYCFLNWKTCDVFVIYIGYYKLDNFRVKNGYSLLWILKLWNLLACAKFVIRLNLSNVYYQKKILENNEYQWAFYIEY